jgi:hypothetical protein
MPYRLGFGLAFCGMKPLIVSLADLTGVQPWNHTGRTFGNARLPMTAPTSEAQPRKDLPELSLKPIGT